MTLINTIRANRGMATVLGFTLCCALGFGFLWVKSGGTIPVVHDANDYRVYFYVKDSKNLREDGEVRIAGVKVGQVESRKLEGDRDKVEISLDSAAVPLHEGATVRIGVKSLVGSSFVEVVDGKGPAIDSGATIDAKDVIPAVDVDELLDTLDAPTRRALQGVIRGLGKSTRGTGSSVNALMDGVGSIGREGYTVLDALQAQSADLTAITYEVRQLLDALDTGQGQIVSLVDAAQNLTSATAEKRQAVENLVQQLPTLLHNVDRGAVSLQHLAGPLTPIAHSLRVAAPDLNSALVTLPSVTADLHGLLPSLDGTLDLAPRTLDRVPAFSAALSDLVPDAQTLLSDVNPMLAYLSPYGLDLGALFANFGASFDTVAPDGIMPIRLTATAEGVATVKGNPVDLTNPSLWWLNPYPAPGTVDSPSPFTGKYPRVTRDR